MKTRTAPPAVEAVQLLGVSRRFLSPTIRRRSASSPRGCRHLHTHLVLASDAYLVRAANAVISAQLQGKAVTRLTDMQMGGKKNADCWLVNPTLHRGWLWTGLKVEVQATA